MTTRTLAEIDQDVNVASEIVPRMLDGDQVAGLLQVTRRQLNRLVHIGEFPKPLLVGSERRWLARDYNAYVAAKLREQQAKRKRHA